MTLPCIRCGRELEPVDPGGSCNQPHAGTTFACHGHFGSTVFDPDDGTFLQLNVCDKCMLEAAVLGQILHGTPARPVPRPAAVLRPWEPALRWDEELGRACWGDDDPPF